ncbi:MATE efflux family protein [Pisolithus marmoratus]|nr:MATE efflux family protein [Pisolithus marmoratus]
MSPVGASSSIPQDRGLLARHAGTIERRYQTGANAPPSEDFDDIGQFAHCRPAPMTQVSGANAGLPLGAFETTPLLPPPVPYILMDATAVSIRSPVLGIHLFEHSIMMATVISIGHISTVALAAATLGFMTANVTGLSIVQGMANTLDTVLPPAWTSDQPQLVGLWTQRMTLLMCAVLIPVLALWLHAELILLGLNQDPEIAKLAGIYLKWAALGLPAYAFNCVARRYFQSQGLFTVPTRIILYVAPVSIFLNYLLVWGPQPFRLGFIGAPIAASISYNVVAATFVVYGVLIRPKDRLASDHSQGIHELGLFGQIKHWRYRSTGILLVSLQASLDPFLWRLSPVLITTSTSFFQAAYALGIATSVRIGNLLGEKNAKSARAVVKASFVLITVLATLFSSILIIFRRSLGYLFNDDPEVVKLVAAVLPLVALVRIFDDSGAVVAGILRARGEQVLGATLNIRQAFPLALWLTFKRDFGLFGLWWGLNLAMIFATSIGLYLCLTTDWDKEVEKVVARLAVDKGYRPVDEERASVHIRNI